MKLVDFVENKPDDKLNRAAFCPFCQGEKLIERGSETTLLGGGPNVNHVWEGYTCRNCKEDFTRESKNGHVWYTQKHKVLLGFPDCFESYIYDHKDCGGEVRRRYTALDGTSEVGALQTQFVDGKAIRHYRTFYDCGKCSATIEVEGDR